MRSEYLNYLCCPQCRAGLQESEGLVLCSVCKKKYVIEDGIFKIPVAVNDNIEISIEKWDQSYQKTFAVGDHGRELEEYREKYFQDVYRNIVAEKDLGKSTVYLEIGCGPFLFGNLIAHEVALIIGVDFSLTALKVAKQLLEERHITNYVLIQSDILRMPMRDGSVDLIYGGGVIEHFKDTQTCINELFRILKNGGVCVNSVPYLNMASLTYRQLWGNIPNLSGLKQIAEFIHIKMLRKKHMIFGYEMSFLGSTLRKIHKRAGFGRVKIEKFDIHLTFDFLPKLFRPFFIYLAKNSRLFWPMIKVVGTKDSV